jgi:hypothetical protein
MKQGSNGDGSSANFANERELENSYGLPGNEHTNAARCKSRKDGRFIDSLPASHLPF